MDLSGKSIAGAGLQPIWFGADLNAIEGLGDVSGVAIPGDAHVCRQDAVRSDYGFRAVDKFPTDRGALWWRSSRACPELRGTVSRHGLRAADVAGESARHRSLPVGTSHQALPHGPARSGSALHAGRCERVARLAHLGRFRASADPPGAASV